MLGTLCSGIHPPITNVFRRWVKIGKTVDDKSVFMSNFYQSTREHPVDLLQTLDAKLPEALAEAVQHTWEVARREHIKADRIERISTFLTDLKRMLCRLDLPSYSHKCLLDAFCNKRIWHDVGILVPGAFTKNYCKIDGLTEDRLLGWLALANAATVPPENDIDSGLTELNRKLAVFDQQIDQVKRLNTQADRVMGSLVSLIESAAER